MSPTFTLPSFKAVKYIPISKCPYIFFKECNKFNELSSVFGLRLIATHLGIFFSTLKETLFIFITLFIKLRS